MEMDERERSILAISSLMLGYGVKLKEKKRRKQRRMWVKPWILQRERFGAYNALINEFTLSEREDYRRLMRITSRRKKHLCEN